MLETNYTISPQSREFGSNPRRVRVYFNKQLIAESREMMLLRENEHLPLYYFPKEDVRMEHLQSSDHMTHSDHKGNGIFWHVQVGSKIASNSAFTFCKPSATGPKLEEYIAFKWDNMDAWFEEDEEVFVYARDPHKRVEVLQSSRHINVVFEGITIAETKRPYLLFETGLPTRYYMSKQDVRMDLLERTDTITRCPYKGESNLYALLIEGTRHEGLIWSYRYPTMECAKIQGRIGFFNEKLDIYEDDKLLLRPKTIWS